MSFFRDVHHCSLSSFRPQYYACAFTPGDHQKSYTPLLFCLPHIKVKNAPEDKVKYENNSGLWKARDIAQNFTK